MEPYAQIPEELQAGSPGTWSQLQGALPTRCEGIGTLIDTGGGGVTVDQLAYELADRQYENPTKAWAANPATRNAAKDEVVTFPGGPKATGRMCLADLRIGVGDLGAVPERELQLRVVVQRQHATRPPTVSS